MCNSYFLTSVFLMFCMIRIMYAVRQNITSGMFLRDKYMDTHVILVYEKVGPRMCVEDCMLFTGCNAVNYRRDKLLCELLTETYPVNQLSYRQGSFYTKIHSWKKDTDGCTPNPCKIREQCVPALNMQNICIQVEAPCDSEPCQNSGVCRNELDGYRCICLKGYSGNHCQYNPCYGITCEYGGTCKVSGSSWDCICPRGYEGTKCQFTPCYGIICEYGGTCKVSGSRWDCICPRGYEGTTCQRTPCYGIGCKYGGTCKVSGSSWYCKCPRGYGGNKCQRTPCYYNTCKNGGTCKVSGSSWYCK